MRRLAKGRNITLFIKLYSDLVKNQHSGLSSETNLNILCIVHINREIQIVRMRDISLFSRFAGKFRQLFDESCLIGY